MFDYSKGAFTTISLTGHSLVTFANGAVTYGVTNAINTSLSSVIVAISGFSKPGQGKLSGPDGNEMDTEEFLASLSVQSNAGGAISGITAGNLPFQVVTQKYGKGIVEYGKKAAGTNGLN